MALYHLTVNVGNRKGGKSALAKMQYIEREGKYAKDSEELEYKESGNMPEWAADDPAEYWAAADEHERGRIAYLFTLGVGMVFGGLLTLTLQRFGYLVLP